MDQTKRGCFYKGQWYKPNSEVERGQSGSWCYGTYCNKASVVIHWDDQKCKSPITTPPVFNRKKGTTQGEIESPQQAIFNMFAPGGSSGGNKVNFEGASSATFTAASSTTTTNPIVGCIFNGQWYAPGTDIQNVRDFDRCYGTYCDFKSKVRRWNEACPATVSPFTRPPPTPPTQSMQAMQRQMQQLESLMKK